MLFDLSQNLGKVGIWVLLFRPGRTLVHQLIGVVFLILIKIVILVICTCLTVIGTWNFFIWNYLVGIYLNY